MVLLKQLITTTFTFPRTERLNLLNKLRRTDDTILRKNDANISKVLLFRDDSFNDAKTTSVLVATNEYINCNITF